MNVIGKSEPGLLLQAIGHNIYNFQARHDHIAKPCLKIINTLKFIRKISIHPNSGTSVSQYLPQSYFSNGSISLKQT